MSFWNYIGELLLFRWLFGKFRKSATERDTHTEDFGSSIGRDNKCLNDNYNEDIVSIDDAVTPIGDNLIDDSDNSEELDDLDIFMRDNSGNNHSYRHHGDYGSDYHAGRYGGPQDWNSGNYSQSFDDFQNPFNHFYVPIKSIFLATYSLALFR